MTGGARRRLRGGHWQRGEYAGCGGEEVGTGGRGGADKDPGELRMLFWIEKLAQRVHGGNMGGWSR